jgi:hypothetical protein
VLDHQPRGILPSGAIVQQRHVRHGLDVRIARLRLGRARRLVRSVSLRTAVHPRRYVHPDAARAVFAVESDGCLRGRSDVRGRVVLREQQRVQRRVLRERDDLCN